MRKQKVNYAEFKATRDATKTVGTVANLIERYIHDMNGTTEQPGLRPLGTSSLYTLRIVQRAPIGLVVAEKLHKSHVIEHCRERRKDVCGATVNHDVVALSSVLKYAGSAWSDCENVSDAAVSAAKPFLNKHGLVAKSIPRDRRPQSNEIQQLEDYFAKQNELERTQIDMVTLARWQIASGRRIGESCRLLWADWNREAQTILVRKMKDPRNRDKNKVVALRAEAQAMLIKLCEKRDPNEPRIFPYNAKSAGARYTLAKKALGITNLRLHDSRRECSSRLVEEGYTSAEAIGFTGHETTAVFERTYMRLDPATLKDGPASRRAALQS